MEVAVTGGTGYVGRAVCRHLLDAGHRVRLLTRQAGRARQELSPGISRRVVDFSSPDSLADGLRGTEAVIHLVGIIGETRVQTFERVHVETTTTLLEGARRAGATRWIHMSALGTRDGATSRYHRTKWASEQRVRDGGLDWTIFRPSVIYGPEDAFVNLFAGMARWSPFVPLIGGGGSLLQPIAINNVASAFARAVQAPSSVGKTLDLCGPERVTLRDLVRIVLEVTNRRRCLVSIPWKLAWAQATLLEWVFSVVPGRPAPLTRDQLRMLREDNIGDGAPADRAFGLQHPSLREGIAAWLGPRR